MNNLILVGMPGCGKSTVGVILAKTLGMDFVDTDLLICKREGTTLQNIIEEKGLEYFSAVEAEVGESLNVSHTVVATGGSMVLYKEAMECLHSTGRVVFIDVSLRELKRRITNIKTRGIAFKKGETLEDIYNSRRPYYERYADYIVEVGDGTIEEAVEKLVEALNM